MPWRNDACMVDAAVPTGPDANASAAHRNRRTVTSSTRRIVSRLLPGTRPRDGPLYAIVPPKLWSRVITL